MSGAGAIASVEDDAFFRASCAAVIAERGRMTAGLEALGFAVLPSSANFVFARHGSRGGAELAAALRERAVIVRHFGAARTAVFGVQNLSFGGLATFGRFQQGATRDRAQRPFRRGVGHVRIEGGSCFKVIGGGRGGLFGHRAAPLSAGSGRLK